MHLEADGCRLDDDDDMTNNYLAKLYSPLEPNDRKIENEKSANQKTLKSNMHYFSGTFGHSLTKATTTKRLGHIEITENSQQAKQKVSLLVHSPS